MRLVVIGLGSMGRRRLRLLQKIGNVELCGVDLSEDRRDRARIEFGIEVFSSLQAALDRASIDAAVICTSPLSHSPLVEECLDNGLQIFTELNLVKDGYELNRRKADENKILWFPSSTFVYRKEIEAIQSMVGEKPKGAWTYHVGQYLPDWHPWESYTDFFVADKRTSGIRELLAIELPWLVKTFGPVASFARVSQSITSLEIPYEDALAVVVRHVDGSIGTLLIDVACRKAVREFTFTSEEQYIAWNGTPFGLQRLDVESGEMVHVDVYGDESASQRDDYASFIVENAYEEELRAFLASMSGASAMRWTIEEDEEIINLIDGLEQQ